MINSKSFFTLVFSFIFFSTYSQDKTDPKEYGSASAQLGLHKGTYTEFGVDVNKGIRIDQMYGAGIGVEALKFKGKNSMYAPVYGDFRYFFPPGLVMQSFFIGQAGYGLYNYKESHTGIVGIDPSTLTGKGGFFYGIGLGVSGRDKVTPTLSLRYTSYGFKYSKTGYYFKENTQRANAFSMNFGVTF